MKNILIPVMVVTVISLTALSFAGCEKGKAASGGGAHIGAVKNAVAVDNDKIEEFVKAAWSWGGYPTGNESLIIKTLSEYITIPNDSLDFDPEWSEHGYMDKAINLLAEAVEKLKTQWGEKDIKVDDITVEILGNRDRPEINEQGKRRTPLICVNIPAFGAGAPDSSVLLYGHMDKQPEMLPWAEGLSPRTPVIKDDKLYGRGGADDGYAIFSAFTAIMALRAQNAGHARCLIIIESCEESDSVDLPYYIDKIQAQISPVSLIVCLDSGSNNYDQMWVTTSLRGVVNAWVDVRVMSEGVHSGTSSGIVPSSFRIARQLISRLENETTGEIKPAWLKADIPAEIKDQAKKTAGVLGKQIYSEFPFVDGAQPVTSDLAELLLNNTWRSQLSITGMQGLPNNPQSAGNVMLPNTRFKISMRLPPTLDSEKVADALTKELTANPPYNAAITVSDFAKGNGWAAPLLSPWLAQANKESSARFFRTSQTDTTKETMYMGEGGSIPFMGLLGQKFPQAQFMITGILGPHSNAHGPNEFLDLPYVQKVTMCVAHVLAAHHAAIQK